MPRLSRLFIRSALLCLGIGFTIGGLILAAKAGLITPLVWGWLPSHLALLIFGWLVQLSFGVAYWILPRNYGGDRGRTPWAWASFITYQAGLALTLLSLLGLWLPEWRLLGTPGMILLGLGAALFAFHVLPRIRPTVVGGGPRTSQNGGVEG